MNANPLSVPEPATGAVSGPTRGVDIPLAPMHGVHGRIPRTVRRSESDRPARLLIDATRDFGNLRRPSGEQITQYKELFYQLVDKLNADQRRMVSAMLARLAFTPRAVALYFAQDKTEIAAPFLLFSTVLGDMDLRAIAKKKGKSHAAIIAKRQLETDEFTQTTLDAVINAPEVPDLTQAEELPEQEVRKEKWLAGDEIVALAGVGGRLGRHGKAKPSRTSPPPQKRSRLTQHLPARETRHLLSLARKRDFTGIADFVQELCDLEASATLRLLQAPAGQEVVYLIKALGMTSPHDIQFLLMACPTIGRRIEHYQETKKLLGELDGGICRMIFNEIGARFEIAGHPAQHTTDSANGSGGFQEAARRRRESFETDSTRQPLSPFHDADQPSPVPLMATG